MSEAYFEDHPTDPDKVILRKQPLDLNPYRNMVIEEVAQEIERKFKFAFGLDTVASFATFIRGMKQ